MDDAVIFRIGLLLWAVFAATAAFWVFTLKGTNVSRRIALARSRWAGGISGGIALLLTVPQMPDILWDWMVPLYVPAVTVFLILSIIYLDYAGSRGLAGIVLVCAYYFLHYSFALRLQGAVAGCVFCWLAAIWATAIAAKPCWMRDQIQWFAGHPRCRAALAMIILLTSLYCIYGSIVL